MSDSIAGLYEILRPLRYRERWVTNSGGLLVSLVVCASCISCSFLLGLTGWIALSTGPGGFVLAYFVWWVARGAYWRTGSGKKVGIAYEGHSVPMADWARTREEITRLVEERKLDDNISLRLLPRRMIDTDEKLEKVRKKYGFAFLLHIALSPQSGTNSSNAPLHMEVKFGGAIAAKAGRQFLKDVAQLHLELLRRPAPKDLLGLLKHRAETILQPIILWLGVTEFLEGNYVDASRLLTVLDQLPPPGNWENPRLQSGIRSLDALALLTQSHFPPNAPPGPDALAEAISAARTCVQRYGSHVPIAYLTLARNLFYEGEIEEALRHTEQALMCPLDEEAKRVALLHLAVLNLLLGRVSNAADAFEELRDSGQLGHFNWRGELVQFADFASSLGHESAVYLQALYRRFADPQAGEEEFDERAITWLGQDASRDRLRRLLEWAETPLKVRGLPNEPSNKKKKVAKRQNRKNQRKRRQRR